MNIHKFFINSSVVAALFLTAGFTSHAQTENTLRFIPEELDFGTIREENGKVTKNVKAVNISNAPTFIISARTSCGCSSLEYPEKQLAPGDTALISVTYNPQNRPGKFQKTAKLYTGEERIGNTFRLKGNVIPGTKSLNRSYPEKSGILRLSTKMIDAGEVSRQEARPLFVGIYNDSDKPLKMRVCTDGKPLEAALSPDSIGPNEISAMTMMLKAREIKGNTKEIHYKVFIINRESGDTITSIPVGGLLRNN